VRKEQNFFASALAIFKSAVVPKESTTIDYLSATDKYWLGEQLNAARLLRGFDIPAAARMLNLSQAQVMAIEAGRQSPFMHIAHYIHNVHRFAEMMDTPHANEVLSWLERTEALRQGDDIVSSQELRINKLIRSRPSGGMVPASGQRFGRLGISLTFIALGFVATLMLMQGFKADEHSVVDHKVALSQTAVIVSLNNAPLVGALSIEPANEPANAPVNESESKTLNESIKASTFSENISERMPENILVRSQSKILGFNFTAPCWVQITSSDGQVIERLYQVAEMLHLNLDQIASLVIGNVAGAQALTDRGNPIDFNAFASGGNVARINGQDLASLVAFQ
jgi:transcriptional regulator with XRE-family HTH domain